jgi:hypothetical protein
VNGVSKKELIMRKVFHPKRMSNLLKEYYNDDMSRLDELNETYDSIIFKIRKHVGFNA